MSHAAVRPIRIRVHDPVLGVDKLERHGFTAHCHCAYPFKWRPRYSLARADANEHNREHRGKHGAIVS